MERDIEHTEKAIAACQKMREGLNELVDLFHIADDTFNEIDRLETYKTINRTIEGWQNQYEAFLADNVESFEQTM